MCRHPPSGTLRYGSPGFQQITEINMAAHLFLVDPYGLQNYCVFYILFMAQKSNPISLRLEKTNKHWNSCWYGDYNYTTQLLQGCGVQAHMENICQQAKVAPPVLFINRGRQRIDTLFFFPPQQLMRKIRVNRGKTFSVPERQRDWLSDFILIHKKKTIKHNSPTFTPEKTGREKIFQYLLLSLFSPGCHSPRGFTSLENIPNLQQLCSALMAPTSGGSAGLWQGNGQRGYARKMELFDTSPQWHNTNTNFAGKSFSKTVNHSGPWKNHLEQSILAQTHSRSKVHYLMCPSVHQNPLFLATQVVFSLEERIPFRRLKHRLMREISKDNTIKGVRITCSGRVAARSKKAQKARTESIQWGQTSLHVFSDLVHFASKSARTGFGKIGVKVWICYRA